MNEDEQTALELRRLRRMLKQMHSLSEHASLTGALSEGATDAVQQYNRILRRLEDLNVVTAGIFSILPADASFDRLGVLSKLLEGYLADEIPDSGKEGREGGGHKIIIGSNLGEINGLEELKDLGRIIRENLPEFLRKRSEAPAPPTPPTPPTPPAPPAPPYEHRSSFSEE